MPDFRAGPSQTAICTPDRHATLPTWQSQFGSCHEEGRSSTKRLPSPTRGEQGFLSSYVTWRRKRRRARRQANGPSVLQVHVHS